MHLMSRITVHLQYPCCVALRAGHCTLAKDSLPQDMAAIPAWGADQRVPEIQQSLNELPGPLDRRPSRSNALSTEVLWTSQQLQPGVDIRQWQRPHHVKPAARHELRGQFAGDYRYQRDAHAGLFPRRVTSAPAAAQNDWLAAPRHLGQLYKSKQSLGLTPGQHSLLHELRQLQHRPVSPAPLRADKSQPVSGWSVVRPLNNGQQPPLQVAGYPPPDSMPLDLILPELGSLVEPEVATATLRHSDNWGASVALPLPQECLPLHFDSLELPAAECQAAGSPQQQNSVLCDQSVRGLRQQPSDAPLTQSCGLDKQLADMLAQPRLHSPVLAAINLQQQGSLHTESAGTVMDMETQRNKQSAVPFPGRHSATYESQVKATAALAPLAQNIGLLQAFCGSAMLAHT